ncbi:hypothetical protein ACFLV0_06220 [Chloroflexota bacterium]
MPNISIPSRGLSRLALPILLVIAIGGMLWFAPQAQALTISISPTAGSGTLGSTYTFTVTINVEDTVDKLPIQG